MAKERVINTRFWSDNYISELDPIEKLLFLYFITNPYTEICGIYEVSLRQVALDTGIDRQEMIPKILARFSRDGKIYYLDGWIFIKNFAKWQRKNPSVEIGIQRGLALVPEEIMAQIKEIEAGWVQTGTVSPQLAPLKPKLKPKPKPKLIPSKTAVAVSADKSTEEYLLSLNDVGYVMEIFRRHFGTSPKPIKDKSGRVDLSALAAGRLVKTHGREKLRKMLEFILSYQNTDKYCRISTTPLDFEKNWSWYQTYIAQKKNEKDQKKPIKAYEE